MKYVMLLLVLLISGVVEAARGPKDKLATPVFTDQANQTEAFAVNIGTYNSVKLYTPRQLSAPIEERTVQIQNMDAGRYVHVTTWSVPPTNVLNSSTPVTTSWVLHPSTRGAGSYMDLPASVTYYGRLDGGGVGSIDSSATIRGLIHSYNQTLLPR